MFFGAADKIRSPIIKYLVDGLGGSWQSVVIIEDKLRFGGGSLTKFDTPAQGRTSRGDQSTPFCPLGTILGGRRLD